MSAPRLNEFVTLRTLSCVTWTRMSTITQAMSILVWTGGVSFLPTDGPDHQHHDPDQHDDQ
jgi:hypothetical protein